MLKEKTFSLSPFSEAAQDPGQLVKFYTPDGYMAGEVKGSAGPDDYLIELKDDGLDRLVIIQYVYSSMGYGPHWDVQPAYDVYNTKSVADWEKLESIFFPGWEKDCIITEKKKMAEKKHDMLKIEMALNQKKDQLIKALKAELAGLEDLFNGLDVSEDDQYIDVRIQVKLDDDDNIDYFNLHAGAACFDQDHTGFWAAGYLAEDIPVEDLAEEMLSEVLDGISWDNCSL